MLDCSSSFPLILVVNKCNVVHRAMLSRSVYFFALSRWYIFFEFSVLCLKNKIVFISSVWKLYWEYQNEGVGGGKPEHCPLHNDKELWVTQSCAWSWGGTMGGCWNWGKGLWVGSSEKWGWECGMGKRGREGGGGLNELRTDLYKHMEEKRGKKKSLVSAGCETGLIRGVKDWLDHPLAPSEER